MARSVIVHGMIVHADGQAAAGADDADRVCPVGQRASPAAASAVLTF